MNQTVFDTYRELQESDRHLSHTVGALIHSYNLKHGTNHQPPSYR